MTDQQAATAAAPTIFPVLRYADATKAVEWLRDAFGFRTVYAVPDPNGTISHAEMSLGTGILMFGPTSPGTPAPDGAADPSAARHAIYVYVDDVEAHAARAIAAGAEITRELAATDYGSIGYSALDFEGNHWSFGSYLPRTDQG